MSSTAFPSTGAGRKVLEDLAARYLTGSQGVDPVEFIAQLLARLEELGSVSCSLAGEEGLRFQIRQAPALDIAMPRARQKLRLLCARLAVVASERAEQPVNPYGGDAYFACGAGTDSKTACKLAFSNTPGLQRFQLEVGVIASTLPKETGA